MTKNEEEFLEFLEALGGEVAGKRQPDGSWRCECGTVVPTDMALYMHRRHDHIGGQDEFS